MVDLKEFEEFQEGGEDEEKRLLLISMGSSLGKKTRKSPWPLLLIPSIPCFSLSSSPWTPSPLSLSLSA